MALFSANTSYCKVVSKYFHTTAKLDLAHNLKTCLYLLLPYYRMKKTYIKYIKNKYHQKVTFCILF
jgi:hypothetical protein